MESILRSARKPSGPSAMFAGIPRRKGAGGGLGDLLDFLLETILQRRSQRGRGNLRGDRVDPQPAGFITEY